MKVSKKKIVTVLIFASFILIESISIGSSMLEQSDRNKEAVDNIKIEAFLTDEEQKTLDLINAYRKENGLDELKSSQKIQEIARLKAEDIVENEYFSHTSENLGTPFQMLETHNIKYISAGENLAGNTTPQRAVESWINSPSHKDNILDEDFEYTGVCVINSPVYGKVFVQLFIGI